MCKNVPQVTIERDKFEQTYNKSVRVLMQIFITISNGLDADIDVNCLTVVVYFQITVNSEPLYKNEFNSLSFFIVFRD